MIIDELFDFGDWFDPFGQFSPHRDTDGIPASQVLPPAHPTGGSCPDGKHLLKEIGHSQELIKFPNRYGVLLEGHRDWVICKCEKCFVEERFLPLNVVKEEQGK